MAHPIEPDQGDANREVARSRALKRARRTFGDNSVASAVAKVRAIIGVAAAPQSEPLAQAALDSLHRGEEPGPEEFAALEFVIRLLRPVMSSRSGRFDPLPDAPGKNLHPLDLKLAWAAFCDLSAPLVGSVGRIDGSGRHIGTGFVVAPGLIATNRHVLGALTGGSEQLPAGRATINFKAEHALPDKPSDRAAIEAVAGVHPHLDIALLRVADTLRPALPLDWADVVEGLRVAAVGFSTDDQARNPSFVAPVFGGRFSVKLAAVGEILDGLAAPVLFHDCSTTGGASGSPIFSLSSGKVVGIHRAGFFMYRNEAVLADELHTFVGSHGR